jgi:hypothetical protein
MIKLRSAFSSHLLSRWSCCECIVGDTELLMARIIANYYLYYFILAGVLFVTSNLCLS